MLRGHPTTLRSALTMTNCFLVSSIMSIMSNDKYKTSGTLSSALMFSKMARKSMKAIFLYLERERERVLDGVKHHYG